MRLSLILFLAILVLFPGPSEVFPAEGEVKEVVAVITGDEFMGMLKSPGALFFDESKKRLYIADTGNNRLVSLDSAFEYLAALSHENISLPVSIVKDKEGLFYIVDGEKAEIKIIDIKKELVERLELKGVPPAPQQFVPGRLAIDLNDRLYATDKLNERILVFDRAGTFLREITVEGEGFFGFSDVRVDRKGNVYAVDTLGGSVYVFTTEGELVSRFGKRGDKNDEFRFPTSLAVDKAGLIYVLDKHAGSILVFTPTGTFQYTIASPGPKEGQLHNPSYIYIDSEDRIFTIDGVRIQVFKDKKE